ncbi:MAG: hypothetical protein RDV00_03900 [Clostridia bacterium]|nr:hypothetical protein [Clostridia bacterium]
MFVGFLGVFFFFVGIGTLLALAWVAIKYGPPLLALLLKSTGEVLAAWGKAAKQGWDEAGQKTNASGKSPR